MLVCPTCRAENAEDAVNCVGCCGTLLPGAVRFDSRREPVVEDDDFCFEPLKRSRTDWGMVLMFASLVLGLLLGGLRLDPRGSSQAVNPDTTTVTASEPAFSETTLQQKADQIAGAWAAHFAFGDVEVLPATLDLARQATGCQVRMYEYRVGAGERKRVRVEARKLARQIAASYQADAVGMAEHHIPAIASPLLVDSRDPAVAVLALAFLYACSEEVT